jgi:seryl-tRNA synthetase
MIDIQLLRKDIDSAAARLAARKFQLDVATFNALEAERKVIQTRTEDLQAKRNALSKQIGMMKGKGQDTTEVMAEVAGLGDALKNDEGALAAVQARIGEFMLAIPNLPHESVPEGQDEAGNVELRKVGTPRSFDFEVSTKLIVSRISVM